MTSGDSKNKVHLQQKSSQNKIFEITISSIDIFIEIKKIFDRQLTPALNNENLIINFKLLDLISLIFRFNLDVSNTQNQTNRPDEADPNSTIIIDDEESSDWYNKRFQFTT